VPTYENRCTDPQCGHEWEAEQPISEDPVRECPKCGRETAQRLASGGSGFALKGPGWAKDGY